MPSRVRAVLFAFLPALALLAAGEGALRLAGLADPDLAEDPFAGFDGAPPPPFVPDPYDPAFVVSNPANPMVAYGRYRLARTPGLPRVLALGESNVAFFDTDRLADELAVGLHSGDVEVVNAGFSGYGSRRIAALAPELLARFRPDLVVLYFGHNEFVETRLARRLAEEAPASRAARRALARSRLYTAARAGLRALRRATVGLDRSGDLTAPADVTKAPPPAGGPGAWRAAEAVYEGFAENLERIGAAAEAARAAVLVVTPAANLDEPPRTPCFHREPAAGGRAAFERRWKEALGAPADAPITERPLTEGEGGVSPPKRAAAPLQALLADYGPHAAVEWDLAEALEAAGDSAGAAAWARRALDDDCAPWVANDRVRAILRDFARRRGLALLDAEARFAALAPGGRVGGAMFTDHCHLSREGQKRLFAWIGEAAREMASKGAVRIAGAATGG